jgi:hypothetical protein
MMVRCCLLVLLCCASIALAWGPHTEITRAALAVLPEDAAIRSLLGPELVALEKTCWIADHRRDARPDYFPDDYLLFPASPRERDHMNPDVRNTFDPFFQRALQALRTETPANAARWVGALVHYVEDIGAPPHAASIGGALHGPMENWVDARAIQIGGYRPRLLGQDDASATRGLLQRMDDLSDYALQRANLLREPLAAMKERENQPLILEAALESARATADVLLTLGELARSSPGGATLRGAITGADQAYLPQVAARVMLLGTPYSTGADNGRFELRNLPPGRYRLAAIRPGNPVWIGDVELSQDRPAEVAIDLRPSTPAGNRLRNADFSLRWVDPALPDCWRRLTIGYPDRPSKEPGWQSECIRVTPGMRYRIGADLVDGASASLAVRWRQFPVNAVNVSDVRLDNPAGQVVVAPEGAKYLQVIILTGADPARSCRLVWCVEEAQ